MNWSAILPLALLVPTLAQAQKNDPNLEAIGALAAAQVYTQYLYIGVTADAYSKGVYKAKQIRGMMSEADGMLVNVAARLRTVAAQPNLVETDKKYVEETIATIEDLQAEARALIQYAGTGDRKDADAFEATRKAAWERISKLLGLDKKKKP